MTRVAVLIYSVDHMKAKKRLKEAVDSIRGREAVTG